MTHKITINGCKDDEELLHYYNLKKSMYSCGEMVTFTVHTATDTDYSITAKEVRITCDGYTPGGISNYSFLMPDKDVVVNIAARSSMINPFMNGSDMPSTGLMGMDMMNMQPSMNTLTSMNTEQVSCLDSYPWDGKPKFCTICGDTTEESNKFCRECGAPLLPKK